MVEQFHRPATVQEALSLKRRLKDRAAFLAGGTFANAKDSPVHPNHWISLEGLKLDRVGRKGGDLIIGALCRLQQLIEDVRIPDPLQAAASQIASRNVRNMATIGGHVAANLPQSDLIPMLVALEAQVELPGARAVTMISVLDYITAGQNGLITKIIIPRRDRHRVAACGHVRGSANARSLLSAAVSLTPTEFGIRDPIIALAGVAQQVVRLSTAEKALHGKPLPPTDQLAAMISRCVRPTSTPFAGAPFRKYQAGVVVALALQEALRPKGGRG